MEDPIAPQDSVPQTEEELARRAANQAAVRLIARFVQFGSLLNEDELPEHWKPIYQFILPYAKASRRARENMLVEALHDVPEGYEVAQVVFAAMPRIEDRNVEHRVLYTAKDALYPPPRIDWSVDQLFARPSLNILVGDPGAKKTYFALDLAVSISMGKDWLGHKTEPSPVLFVDEEAGLYQLWGRLNSVLLAHSGDTDVPLYFTSLASYDLRKENDARDLLERALNLEARLIIFDGLASLLRGSPDNNFATVQPVLFQLRLLAENCRASVLVLHHTNKEGGFRGTSAISAAADLMLHVHSPSNETLLEFQTLKARYVAPQPFCARADFTPAPDGSPRFHLEPAEYQPSQPIEPNPLPIPNMRQPAVLRVLDYLSKTPEATHAALVSDLTDFTSETLRSTLQRLKRAGLIKRTNGSGRGKVAVYSLA